MSEEAQAPVESGTEGAVDTGQADSSQTSALAFDPTSLPEGLREEPSLQTFDSVDKLAKSYVNAVKKIGGDPNTLVKIPQEGEDKNAFYNQIGRPEQPQDYNFDEIVGDDPEGTLDGYKEFAHHHGLTQSQAESILNLYGEIQEDEAREYQEAQRQLDINGQIELQKEWGKNFDGKMDMASRAFAEFSTTELKKMMDETGLGNHPEMLRVFAKVGERLGEDSLIVGSGLGANQMSPEQARTEIQNRYSDKEFSKAYRDNREPGHRQAMQEMDKLFRIGYPSQQRAR
tara:strand:- start:15246 stop:16103 length:858 start_codon:yes stop_codon:yes gene_type:complete